MVGVGMRDKEVGYLATLDARTLQLAQHAIASTGIDQKLLTTAACQHKAGVEAFRDQRTTRAQPRDLILHISCLLLVFLDAKVAILIKNGKPREL